MRKQENAKAFSDILKAFFLSNSSEYKRHKQTETIEKGGIYTQMRIDKHQLDSSAELVLCFKHQSVCEIQRENQ